MEVLKSYNLDYSFIKRCFLRSIRAFTLLVCEESELREVRSHTGINTSVKKSEDSLTVRRNGSHTVMQRRDAVLCMERNFGDELTRCFKAICISMIAL